ncbi:MAG TPA: TIGR04211 family SH3 domain-containing protein, partial [Woeseiaceae bacterium]|nr:TIGR04211 family SH3 domain-containing protein [Woeseiaceae bacterium]
MIRLLARTIFLLGSCFFAAMAVRAEPAWVSDQFEVMLRTGPTTSNAITRVLQSGAELDVLERDSESGYARVRTPGGTEGYVLIRYLMNEPSAREQLQRLTGQLTSATTRDTTLTSQLDAIKGQYDEAATAIAALESDKQALQEELGQIREAAANTLAIDRQNKDLRQQLTDAEIKVSILEQENEALSGQTTRN